MGCFSNFGVSHNCYCTFIPPFILENLARAGVEDAALTIQQDRLNRVKRASTVPNVATLMGATPMGRAARQVFDSQNKWEFQVKLVREEGGPVVADEVVNSAYDCIGNLLDYSRNKLNRNSLDNSGMDIICNVHYGTKYNGAFFDGNRSILGMEMEKYLPIFPSHSM